MIAITSESAVAPPATMMLLRTTGMYSDRARRNGG
jgi:hypothetical protein